MSDLLERPAPASAEPTPDPGTGATGRSAVVPPPGRTARAAAAVAVLALLAAGVTALFGLGGGTTLPRGVVAVVTAGTVELASERGWRPLAVGDRVPAEGRVRAVDDTATLEVDDGELRLAGGTDVTLGATSADIERGSVLVAGGTRTVTIAAVTARGTGTWRVDDGGRPRIASYDGEVTVEDGAATVAVPTLRQLSVRDGSLQATDVQPLRYLAADPFDAELLAEALRVDDLAASLERSLASQHGTEPRELAFYRSFVAVGPAIGARLRDAAPDVADDRFGPPSDVLLTVVMIDAAETETTQPRGEVADQVVALRRDGASWGLVALDLGIDGTALSAAAQRALERAEADPPPELPPETPPEPDPPPSEPTPDPDPPADGPTIDPGSQPAPPPPTSDDGDPASGDGDDGGALRPVEDLLRDTGSGLGEVVEGTTDTLGDVVGGVDELLQPGGLLGR